MREFAKARQSWQHAEYFVNRKVFEQPPMYLQETPILLAVQPMNLV